MKKCKKLKVFLSSLLLLISPLFNFTANAQQSANNEEMQIEDTNDINSAMADSIESNVNSDQANEYFATSEHSNSNIPISDTKYIHLNSYEGNDNNDGLSVESSVQTFTKAKSLLNDGDIILLDRCYNVTGEQIWDLNEFPNSKIQRNCSANMIEISDGGSLTLTNIRIDGAHYDGLFDDGFASIISMGKPQGNESNSSKLFLNFGAILENNINSGGYGGAISANSYNLITINDGAIIQNNGTLENYKAPIYGGAISLENNSELIMNGGTISNNHAVTGGAVSVIASSMVMNNGSIINNSANNENVFVGHYGGAICLRNYAEISGAPAYTIKGEASFIMTNGTISGNKATYKNSNGDKGLGGAIATFADYTKGCESEPKITVNITGGQINQNKAINGGAISAYFGATDVNLSNVTLNGNEAEFQGGAIYCVFNASLSLNNSIITQNKAQLGGGTYLYASEMVMHSGELDNNTSLYGGGVYIDSPAWNKQIALCRLLGGSVKNNKATKNIGSDGIYQDSKLEIGENAEISNNDVFLPSGKIIDVVKPLQLINSQNTISITSEDCVVEDNVTAGTKLILYHLEAGGIEAAIKAENEQFYVPSNYMKEDLVIGKSMFDNQLDYMTYIRKQKFPVKYSFISGTKDKSLPTDVVNLIPDDNLLYLEGVLINAIKPSIVRVDCNDGYWVFSGYDSDIKEACTDNLNNGFIEFIGTWNFIKNEKPNDSDKKPSMTETNNNWDDGGPFTTDECGKVYDRWGNLMWAPEKCILNTQDYNLVNTADK